MSRSILAGACAALALLAPGRRRLLFALAALLPAAHAAAQQRVPLRLDWPAAAAAGQARFMAGLD